MARERMAKLLKYGHFEGSIGHIFINIDIIKNLGIISEHTSIVISAPRLQIKIWLTP